MVDESMERLSSKTTLFKEWCLLLLLFLLFVLLFSSWPMFHYNNNLMQRIIVIIFILHVSNRLLYALIKNETASPLLKNGMLMVWALTVTFLILEALFMFVPRSHGVGYSLAAKNWVRYYWKPLNTLGYRDKEVQGIPGKKNIVIVGDSFVAGQGINNPECRFSNLLEKKLGGQYRVYNLGRCGADTRVEYDDLMKFPVKPDILILAYLGNDIDAIAYKKYKEFSGFALYSDLYPAAKPFVQYSYLINYIYWLFPHADTAPYFNLLKNAYQDEELFSEHMQDLDEFIGYSLKEEIPFIVLLFPFMIDYGLNEAYMEKIAHYFSSRGIPVVNVADSIAGVPQRKRIINSNDGHPSVYVNKLVADALYGMVLSLERTPEK
jgi:lysophospholipase L1-like esterase